MVDMNNGKIHGIQTRLAELRIDLEGALVRRLFKPRDLSSRSCVDFATQYNVLQVADRTLVVRASFGNCTAAIIFPTTKWRKKSPNSVTVHL